MATLTKLIVSIILALLLLSCEFNANWGTGRKGDGNVIADNVSITSDFNEIHASRGLDVYLTQSNVNSVTIEADSNLHEIITVEVVDNVLKITTEESIGSASSKKVLVNFNTLSRIVATSGSDVFSTDTISLNELDIETNSGSDVEIDINTEKVTCSASSGSDIDIQGNTNYLMASASSGSDIDAGDLLAEISTVKATSGASISVNTTKELIAKANSGGDVVYYGNPSKLDTSEGVSGGISKR